MVLVGWGLKASRGELNQQPLAFDSEDSVTFVHGTDPGLSFVSFPVKINIISLLILSAGKHFLNVVAILNKNFIDTTLGTFTSLECLTLLVAKTLDDIIELLQETLLVTLCFS